jgi:regulator of sirC expression with transglutaminase-like and TPR domain
MNPSRCNIFGLTLLLALPQLTCTPVAYGSDAEDAAAIEAAVRDIERYVDRPPVTFLEAALAANRLAKPNLKAEEIERSIRRLAAHVKKAIGKKFTSEEQLEALNEVIFEREGFYTPERPATLMEGKALDFYALPTVLQKRAAYCEGLALVYTLVAREAGLPVSILRAPAHVYCRYQLNGRGVNIECTAGGRETTEEELMENSGAKPAARASGVYFCELTARGILALQLNSVSYNMVTHKKRRTQLSPEQWKRVASVLLRLQPNDPETLNTAATIYLMTNDRFTAEMLHRRTLDQVKSFGAPDVLKAGLQKQ